MSKQSQVRYAIYHPQKKFLNLCNKKATWPNEGKNDDNINFALVKTWPLQVERDAYYKDYLQAEIGWEEKLQCIKCTLTTAW